VNERPLSTRSTVFWLTITKLESKLALREIEREGLTREIASRAHTPARRVEALERWDELQTECVDLLTELETARLAYRD
jgi:hypothetical protein